VTPVTTTAISGVWSGTVTVSDPGVMDSVYIHLSNDTDVFGIISNALLEINENPMIVVFTGLSAGIYDMIFNFIAYEYEGFTIEAIQVSFSDV
jgi:hypothetical protein